LLYELITLGAEPYPNMSRQEVIYEVSENHYRMENPQGICTDAYYQMMKRCWNEEPMGRPTFDSLFNFFNDYAINTQAQYQMSPPAPSITPSSNSTSNGQKQTKNGEQKEKKGFFRRIFKFK
jgi:hypothetical protein